MEVQGQGAAIAIEDAAALSVVLPLGTKKEEVPDRLRLYDEFRHERATKIQYFSRVIGGDDLLKKKEINSKHPVSFPNVIRRSSNTDLSVCLHKLQLRPRRIRFCEAKA